MLRKWREGLPLYLLITSLVFGIVILNTALQLFVIKKESHLAASEAASNNFAQASHAVMAYAQQIMDPILSLAEAGALQIAVAGLSSFSEARNLYQRSSLQSLISRKNIFAVNYGFLDGTFFSISSLNSEYERNQFHAPQDAAFAIWAVAPNEHGVMREWMLYLDASLKEILMRDYAVSYNPRLKQWFRDAMASEGMVMTRPYIFTTSRKLGMACAKASPDRKAVFSINVTLDNFNDMLRMVPMSKNGKLFLLDEERQFLTSTESSSSEKNKQLKPLPATALPGGKFILDKLNAGNVESNVSSLVPTNDGDWLFRYIPVPIGSRHLYLLMLAPLSDYSAFTGSIFMTTAMFSSIVLIFSLILALWLARMISNPLRELMVETQRIAMSSHENVKLVSSSIYEVDRLAKSVCKMEELINLRTQSLQKMKDHLELLVEERTGELEKERRRAEDASKAKSAFLAAMSHEIRTPMNAIFGFIQLFKTDNLTERQIDYLGKIRMSSEMLLAIINDVLDLSKIEASKMTLENIPFHLSAVVDTIKSIIAPSAKKKGLDVTVDMATDIPDTVMGDPSRLQQVLLNLLSNAVKFTQQGKIELRVEIDPDVEKASDRVALRIKVSDTGIGISKESLGRLFKPFTQADQSITRKYGGTGLGLVICRQLLELMNGSIDVESREGEGTTFTCRVPLMLASDSEQHLSGESPTETKNTRLLSEYAGSHVLVVEDNEMNQEIALYMLELAGLHVSVASNGFEALEFIGKNPVDIVLMDMQMPEMDGLEATRRIRQKLYDSGDICYPATSLPIIAMTANAMTEDKEECLKAGMNDHISKPLDAEKLYASLAYWLGKRKQELGQKEV